MKQTYFFITILLLLSFQGCKKSVKVTPIHPATTYTLTVNGGIGSGTYHAGDTVYVFSNPPTNTQVFNTWTGDATYMSTSNEWRSTLIMPSANINIAANYKTISPVTFTHTTIYGSQVYYNIPSSYRGILLAFHGTGGAAVNWTQEQAENINFCNYAVSNGYAMVITESKNRTTKQWDLSVNNNVDIINIQVILDSLTINGILAPNKPLYGVGMSDGSAFCSLIAYEKGYNAEALYCLGGINNVFPLTKVPTIWNMAVNDVTMDPNRQTAALANYNKLLSRGIPCQYYVNPATPLYASRFTIIPAISAGGSTNIYNAFKSAGYINAKGFFNVDPMVNTAWPAAIPSPYNPVAEEPISDQLYVAYAQHKFYKDSNYRTISFFNKF